MVLLAAIVILGAASLLWLRAREWRCPRCGSLASRLSANEAITHLGPGRKMELDLGSVDHRVYRCPRCGDVHIVSEPQMTPLRVCSRCGIHALTRHEFTIEDRSHGQEGLADVKEECAFCGYQEARRVILPKMRHWEG